MPGAVSPWLFRKATRRERIFGMDALHAPDSTLQPIRGLPHGARALVVEDRQYCHETLRPGLQSLGLEVFLAPNTDRAERILGKVPIDLLILDPLKAGDNQELDWVQSVRRQHPDIALIVVADPSTNELEQRCDALGTAAYLVQPVSLRTLRRCIQCALTCRRLQQKIRRLEQRPAAAPAATETTPGAGQEPEHEVDDLWFAIFEQLLSGTRQAARAGLE